MIILLYDSAIRFDELLDLTIQDFVLGRNEPYIRINEKENKEPLSKVLALFR